MQCVSPGLDGEREWQAGGAGVEMVEAGGGIATVPVTARRAKHCILLTVIFHKASM